MNTASKSSACLGSLVRKRLAWPPPCPHALSAAAKLSKKDVWEPDRWRAPDVGVRLAAAGER